MGFIRTSGRGWFSTSRMLLREGRLCSSSVPNAVLMRAGARAYAWMTAAEARGLENISGAFSLWECSLHGRCAPYHTDSRQELVSVPAGTGLVRGGL